MKIIAKVLVLCLAAFFAVTACKKGDATPEGAVKAIVDAVKKKDFGAFYDGLSKASTAQMEQMLKGMISMVSQMAKANPDALKNDPKSAKMLELEKLTGKEFFIKMMEMDPDKSSSQFQGDVEVLKAEIQGDKAVVTIKEKEKGQEKEQKLTMIKEDGKWKLDLMAMMQEQMGDKK